MDLSNFTEQDIESVISNLFSGNKKFSSIEDAYQQLAQSMYERFRIDGESSLVLSRVYHSFNFLLLPADLQKVASQVWGKQVNETSKLITLMGTYGDKPAWCDRTQSKGHKAILLTGQTLTQVPMVTRLLQQIGFDLGVLLGKEEKGMNLEGIQGSFGIFYVSPALGSPYIPAQDFVVDNGIKCAVGTGVMLPNGDISIYIGFSRVNIEGEVAANIAALMSLFWQRAYPILEEHGMFAL